MSRTIGYFEGTDSILLTRMSVKGYGTMPIGNHYDRHGKLVSLIRKGEIKALVGYVHKILPPVHEDRPTAFDKLQACKTHEIPVFLIAPEGCEVECEKLLGEEVMEFVHLVTTQNAEEELEKIL
ncbi:MAG: hypothetical protein ACXAB4_02065 [Candidatus Hodarchaeales archaeon]